MPLPHCDDLYLKFLDPWCSQSDRVRRRWPATRPDVLEVDNLSHETKDTLAVLQAKDQSDVARQIDKMLDACREDWPRYLNVYGEFDERWIAAFDDHYDRDRIEAVIARSDPADFSNDYLVLVCEFGAALGYVLRERAPRLIWRHDWPYWESTLVDLRSGSLIPPFHWAVKKFSEYGVDDGFSAKIDMCVSLLNRET